jgi:hypothetical protein
MKKLVMIINNRPEGLTPAEQKSLYRIATGNPVQG